MYGTLYIYTYYIYVIHTTKRYNVTPAGHGSHNKLFEVSKAADSPRALSLSVSASFCPILALINPFESTFLPNTDGFGRCIEACFAL